MSRSVLLVGSIPAESNSEVFETLASALGPLAKRLPDGETGARSRWIAWQAGSFAQVPGLEPGQRIERGPGDYLQQYRLPAGTARAPEFGALGYAASAIESYQVFKALRAKGTIAAGTRLQVCLPTPLAVVWAFIEPPSIPAVWPAYERALAKEIDQIATAIPAADLAFQWDIAVEPVFILGRPEMLKHFPEDALVASVARASAHVPAEAELGLHLCFGDTAQKHAIVADDLGLLVPFANKLVRGIAHKLAWVHFPAPPKSDYERFFAPLKNLEVAAGTEIYVGLVNLADGIEGARQRLSAVKRVVPNPGIAAECGLGRRPPETLDNLLALHKAAATLG
jgi:hypothetical protein